MGKLGDQLSLSRSVGEKRLRPGSADRGTGRDEVAERGRDRLPILNAVREILQLFEACGALIQGLLSLRHLEIQSTDTVRPGECHDQHLVEFVFLDLPAFHVPQACCQRTAPPAIRQGVPQGRRENMRILRIMTLKLRLQVLVEDGDRLARCQVAAIIGEGQATPFPPDLARENRRGFTREPDQNINFLRQRHHHSQLQNAHIGQRLAAADGAFAGISDTRIHQLCPTDTERHIAMSVTKDPEGGSMTLDQFGQIGSLGRVQLGAMGARSLKMRGVVGYDDRVACPRPGQLPFQPCTVIEMN